MRIHILYHPKFTASAYEDFSLLLTSKTRVKCGLVLAPEDMQIGWYITVKLQYMPYITSGIYNGGKEYSRPTVYALNITRCVCLVGKRLQQML